MIFFCYYITENVKFMSLSQVTGLVRGIIDISNESNVYLVEGCQTVDDRVDQIIYKVLDKRGEHEQINVESQTAHFKEASNRIFVVSWT